MSEFLKETFTEGKWVDSMNKIQLRAASGIETVADDPSVEAVPAGPAAKPMSAVLLTSDQMGSGGR
jgi:hypothetical protein